ncbi:ZrgA family zinc uptake protein [Lampropedia puyangensis]|nr:DUF2796 domain-containing protein [Lampropedia puyangensis]
MTTLISTAHPRRRFYLIGVAASSALISYGHNAQAHEHTSEQNQTQAAHVHGVVQLDVAVDGSDLVLQLTAPQADITGFERAAQTEAEKQTVAQAIEKLKLPSLIALNASAACKLVDTDIDGLGADSHDAHDKDHGKAHDHSHETDTKAKDHGHPEHAAQDKKAAKDEHDHADEHDHDHDHKEGEHSHAHNDVSVSWQWHCDHAQQLESIDVQLAKQFSSIHTINVQMAMPQGQFSRTLKTGETRLTWK